MSNQKIIDEIKAVLARYGKEAGHCMAVSNIRTVPQERYLTKHRNLYESITNRFEDLEDLRQEALVEFVEERLSKADVDRGVDLEDMPADVADAAVVALAPYAEAIKANLVAYDADDSREPEGLDLREIAEISPEAAVAATEAVYRAAVAGARAGTIEDRDLEVIFMNTRSSLESFRGENELSEAIAYWTTYWEPERFDADVAARCGLVAFGFDDMKLLALGGSGMDLSPKLDAYQALTHGSVPADSMFIRQADYARGVVGDAVFEEVMKKVARESPEITINL